MQAWVDYLDRLRQGDRARDLQGTAARKRTSQLETVASEGDRLTRKALRRIARPTGCSKPAASAITGGVPWPVGALRRIETVHTRP